MFTKESLLESASAVQTMEPWACGMIAVEYRRAEKKASEGYRKYFTLLAEMFEARSQEAPNAITG